MMKSGTSTEPRGAAVPPNDLAEIQIRGWNCSCFTDLLPRSIPDEPHVLVGFALVFSVCSSSSGSAVRGQLFPPAFE